MSRLKNYENWRTFTGLKMTAITGVALLALSGCTEAKSSENDGAATSSVSPAPSTSHIKAHLNAKSTEAKRLERLCNVSGASQMAIKACLETGGDERPVSANYTAAEASLVKTYCFDLTHGEAVSRAEGQARLLRLVNREALLDKGQGIDAGNAQSILHDNAMQTCPYAASQDGMYRAP